LWQVKSGTIFDNVLVTDDSEFAKKEQERISSLVEGEKKMKEIQDEEEKKKSESEKKEEDKDEDDEDKDDEEEKHDEL